ncbi:hypothetical protein HDU85_005082 [Gaertneriomyces sp. JEL0708]|nr:hypothetical protein HDU85_005082 [Gaertneriomyces sp. JEL0708]
MAIFRVLSINVLTTTIFEYQVYRNIFSISAIVYWMVYDNFGNGYLSWVYRDDKYGVVINYLLITAIKLIDIWTRLVIPATVDLIYRVGSKAAGHTVGPVKTPLTAAAEAFRVLGFLSIIKCTLFGLIFKHHTSRDNRIHQTVHIICGGLLGLAGFISRWYELDLVGLRYYRPPQYPFTEMFAMLLLNNPMFTPILRWIGYVFATPDALNHNAHLFAHGAVLIFFGVMYNFVLGPKARKTNGLGWKFLTIISGCMVIQHTV